MNSTIARFLLALVLLAPVAALAKDEQPPRPLSDGEVKRAIISESLSKYPGNCPCPYNLARNGSRCGKRSAYSQRPFCKKADGADSCFGRMVARPSS